MIAQLPLPFSVPPVGDVFALDAGGARFVCGCGCELFGWRRDGLAECLACRLSQPVCRPLPEGKDAA